MVGDAQVRVLGQKGEIRNGIHVSLAIPVLVEQRLGEDVVHLQAVEFAQQAVGELNARFPVLRMTHPGEHIQQWVETRSQAPAHKVIGR